MTITRRQRKELDAQEKLALDKAIAESLAFPVAKHESTEISQDSKSAKKSSQKRKQTEVKGERQSKRLRKESPGEEEFAEESRADHVREKQKTTLRSTPRKIKLQEDRQQDSFKERNESLGRTPRIPVTVAENSGVLPKAKSNVKTSQLSQKTRRGTLRTNTEKVLPKYVVTQISGTRLRVKLPLDEKKSYPPGQRGVILGESPFIRFPVPDPKDGLYDKLFDILKAWKLKDDPSVKFERMKTRQPGHAYVGDIFHAIVMPILSQATENRNQQFAEDRLFKHLTYNHNGEEHVGKTSPNYHKLLNMKWEDLAQILGPSGLHQKRSKALIAIAKEIYAINNERLGAQAAEVERKALDSPEWVDGLLSLNFLRGLSKQEMFDTLNAFPIIGLKTAACIMCFAYNWPVFAVDTHIYRLSAWLVLIPRGCSKVDAGRHLDEHIPDELKRDFHQLLWHHGRDCVKCRGHRDGNSQAYKDAICPLDEYILDRFPMSPRKRKSEQKETSLSPRTGSTEEKKKRTKYTITIKPEHRQMVLDAGYQVLKVTQNDNWSITAEHGNHEPEATYYYEPRPGEEVVFTKAKKVRKSQTTIKKKPSGEVADETQKQETVTTETVIKNTMITTTTKAILSMG